MKDMEDIIEFVGLYVLSFIVVGVADIGFAWNLNLLQMAGLSLVYLVACRIGDYLRPLVQRKGSAAYTTLRAWAVSALERNRIGRH